ncbi:hypothetical protein [Mycolicibacter sinensis]|uniref:hypothetical protein n=1 Tax=Mycolicibacter sinensis (strain JDM601) TaxID=875328 RepID=UPI000B2201ED|nr:hypothetical protein [Mycolicibacter sinensis]
MSTWEEYSKSTVGENAQRARAEYKRRRTVAIKKLREAGLSEEEIQDELAKIREHLGISSGEAKARDSVANLPAVIDPVDGHGRARRKKEGYPKKPNRDERGNSTIKENVEYYDSVLANHAERRCVATNAKGERCRRFAIPGGRVCKTHGGATRHVVSKARVRLEMAANRLIGKELEIAFDDDRPSAVQLDAIKDSLNRAGLKPREQVEIGPIKPYEEIFDDITHQRPDSVGSGHDSDGLYGGGQYDQINYGVPDQAERPRPGREHVSGCSSRAHGDYDRPRGPQSRDQVPPDRNYRDGYHVTGDDAIRAANAVNAEIGALRALPPGRSGC